MAEPDTDTLHTQVALADIFGDLAEFWGFARGAGRIYGLLYASPLPLDQGTIRERLGISVGCVSMSLQQLVDWEVVRLNGRSYTARTDLFGLALQVLRRREAPLAAKIKSQVNVLLATLESKPTADPRTRFVLLRLRELFAMIVHAQTLLDALTSGRPLQRIVRALAAHSAKRHTVKDSHHANYL